MQKREFQATEGLLHDVMRKQAGTVEKAILEAVMNSVDAGASRIDLRVEEGFLVISDDGKGMTTSEVEEYFEKFGLKDDDIDQKDFGKFRMGRGQIFNFGLNIWHSNNNLMVVHLDGDETTIEVDGKEYHLDTSGLSYNLLETEEDVEGCEIEVNLYNDLESVTETVSEVKKLIKYIPWMHDVEVFINDELFYEEFDPDDQTTRAYYSFGRGGWNTDTVVYNQGAFVTELDLNETGGIIISNQDLDVNFARNDILDTCEVFRGIRGEWNHLIRDHLINSDEITEREKKWLLKEAKGDDAFLMKIQDMPLIPDVTDSEWSVNNLKGEKVTFAVEGSGLGRKLMETEGVVAINRSFESTVRDIVDDSVLVNFEDAIDSGMMVEMREYSDHELSKKRRKNLARARYLLDKSGYEGDVKGGYSEERDVWKNDKGDVVIHKNVLKERKAEFLTRYLFKILEAAAHDGSMREEVTHSFNFRRDFWKLAKNAGDVQYELLEGNPDIERFL